MRTLIVLLLLSGVVAAGENPPPGPDGIRTTIPITDFAEVRRQVDEVLLIDMFHSDSSKQGHLDDIATRITKEYRAVKGLPAALKGRGWGLVIHADPYSDYLDRTLGSAVEPHNWPAVDHFRWTEFLPKHGEVVSVVREGTQAQFGRQPFQKNMIVLRVVCSDESLFWKTMLVGLKAVSEISRAQAGGGGRL